MIPKVQTRGHSFKGIAQYLMNDTEDMAPDAERVAWSDTVNLLTDDIEKAARVMAWTDTHSDELKREAGVSLAGRKQEAGNVYHYTLAWAIGEQPDEAHAKAQVSATLENLGLSEHEAMIVAHSDREHFHVHVVANLVHPERGTVAKLGLDQRKLSRWASDYERETGIHCIAREANRGQGIKHCEQRRDYARAVERAFDASDNGKSFVAALDYEGLTLTTQKNNSKLYVVDEHGNKDALTRNLNITVRNEKTGKLEAVTRRAKTRAITAKLADIDRAQLPDGDDLVKNIKAEITQERESQDGDQHKKILAAAEDAIEKKQEAADAAFLTRLKDVELRQLKERDQLEDRLAESAGQKLDGVLRDAENMRGVVEGRGFKFALRRVWRGKKDRAILSDLQEQKATITASMDKPRADLQEIHKNEVGDLKRVHEQERLCFADMDAVQKIKVLEHIKTTKHGIGRKDGARSSIKQGRARRDREIDKQIWSIRQQDATKQKQQQARHDMLADRANAEARASEIQRQDIPEKLSYAERLKQRAEQSQPEEKGTSRKIDKGRDFDM